MLKRQVVLQVNDYGNELKMLIGEMIMQDDNSGNELKMLIGEMIVQDIDWGNELKMLIREMMLIARPAVRRQKAGADGQTDTDGQTYR